EAVAALARGLGSPYEVTSAAHLPAAAAARSSVGYVAGAGTAVTALRLEGFGPSVEHRCRALRDLLGAEEELHGANSRALWDEIATASLLPQDRVLWRVSVAPSAGPEEAATVARALDAEFLYEWAGGLVWIALENAGGDGGAAIGREAGRKFGGAHATILRTPDALRAAVPGFEPVSPLERRIKEAFDPLGILNPGRMGF